MNCKIAEKNKCVIESSVCVERRSCNKDLVFLTETMYAKLREFELRLPRTEVEEVDALRDNWFELMELAEQVREILLKERRGAFEQELDKQVKVN